MEMRRCGGEKCWVLGVKYWSEMKPDDQTLAKPWLMLLLVALVVALGGRC
jgi:hypothetical protein